MDKFTVISLVVRHALTFFGGFGVLGNDEITQVAGAIAAIAGVTWSVIEKRKGKK